jgi:hypothetical protein
MSKSFLFFSASSAAICTARNLNSPCIRGGRRFKTQLEILIICSTFISSRNVSFNSFYSKDHFISWI